MQFAQLFPDFQIVSQLATKLSWSHFIEVLPLKEPLQREFYLTMAANERWSKSNSFSWINRVSVWRNTSPNCHPRKFFCVNCKNPLRRQKRIIPPTDERNTKREKKSKKEQAEKNYNLTRVLRHSFFVSTQRSTLNPHSLTPSTLKWITQWTDKDVWKCGCVNHIIVPFSAK